MLDLRAWHDRTLRSLITRHGGEEFLILLEAAPVEQATAALERVRKAVEGHDWAGIQPGLTVTVSGGLLYVLLVVRRWRRWAGRWAMRSKLAVGAISPSRLGSR